jgi:hypothetical protein
MNQQLRTDVNLRNALLSPNAPSEPDAPQGAEGLPFRWAPERTLAQWRSVSPSDSDGEEAATAWEKEFGEDLKAFIGLPDDRSVWPFLRSASDALCMPMTILWALEKLNDGEEWTRQQTLTVHVSTGLNFTVASFTAWDDSLIGLGRSSGPPSMK